MFTRCPQDTHCWLLGYQASTGRAAGRQAAARSGRVVSWKRRSAGHNKTRPPPFMGWRGPCAPCRTSLASCPARPAKPTAPPGPVTRAIYRFPGSSHVPGVSPEWRPFPAVKAFLRLPPAAAHGVKSYLMRVFSLSTEWRRLSATKAGCPPYCSHVAHRTRIVGFAATKRPRGGGRGWAQ